MFHVLHRIYVFAWIILVLGVLVWVYPRSGASETAADFYAVWQNRPEFGKLSGEELAGEVVRVMDSTSITVQTPDRQLYNIGLLGLAPLAPSPGSPESRRIGSGRTFLKDMVLSNEVEVVLTSVDAYRRGLGVVRIGSTNVNAAMVESGTVRLQRNFIRQLPILDQFAMIRAERKARQQEAR